MLRQCEPDDSNELCSSETVIKLSGDFKLRLTEDDQLVRRSDFSADFFSELPSVAEMDAFDADDILTALQAMFCEIKHPLASAWGEHIPFLFGLITLLRPRRYVELGVHNGASFLAACQAAQTANTGTQCIGVDNWVGEAHAGLHDAGVFDGFRGAIENYGDFAGYVRADFSDAASRFADGSIDLLHIDGFHTMDAVRSDFETWIGKMSSIGVIMFHDTNEFRANFGVWRFWRLVKGKFPYLEFGHGHGLGVLVVGKHSALHKHSDGASIPLLTRMSNNFLQAISGGVGQLSWNAARATQSRHVPGSPTNSGLSPAALPDEVATLKRRIADLEGTVRDMHNSTSWRVTKPLRAAKTLFFSKSK